MGAIDKLAINQTIANHNVCPAANQYVANHNVYKAANKLVCRKLRNQHKIAGSMSATNRFKDAILSEPLTL